jgi:hypothetical protein
MTESSVGISAIAHLLPLLDYVDGRLLLISNGRPMAWFKSWKKLLLQTETERVRAKVLL